MKKFSEQLKKQSETIRLRVSERKELRDRLVSYMEYHPLPLEMRQVKKVKNQASAVVSEPFIAMPINWLYVRTFAGIFVLIMMVVVPVAAEHTNPGDALYTVKVRFNEEVRGTLTLSPYEKIEWETTRLERRIAEARQLASEGKLTEDVEAQVVEAVKAHSSKAKNEIATLRETDSDEAAIAEITFASALAVQSEVLQKTVEKTTVATSDQPVSPNKVGAALATLVAAESDAAEATQAAAAPSYEKLLARVEKESTNAFELFESIKNQANEDERVDIKRRLSDVGHKVDTAMLLESEQDLSSTEAINETSASTSSVEIELASTSEATDSESTETDVEENTPETEVPAIDYEARKSSAVTILRDALTDLNKLMSFMTDITVRESISIESLVPITLTDDERRANILIGVHEVEVFTEQQASTTFSGPKATKLNQAVSEVKAKLEETKKAFDNNDLDNATASVSEAKTLIVSIKTMAGNSTSTITEDIDSPVEETDGTDE